MKIEIRILDTVNGIEGSLDLAESIKSPFKINKSNATITNIRARSGTFSTTFTVPNTTNNNTLLQNIKNINQDVTTKDILNRKEAAIYENGLLIERGFIKINTVENIDGLGSYEIVFFGDNLKWATEAEELKINDINFRNNTLIYDEANIKAAQAGTYATGYDHTYSLINRGQYKDSTTLTVEDFYPDLYIKAIVERGLNQLGYTIDSDFMDSSAFERLIMPFKGVFAPSEQFKEDNKVEVKTTSDYTIDALGYGAYSPDPTPVPNKSIVVAKRIIFQSEISDTSNNYDTSTGYFTAPKSGVYRFKGTLKFTTLTANAAFKFYAVKGNTPAATITMTDDYFANNFPVDVDGLNNYIYPNNAGYWKQNDVVLYYTAAGTYDYDYDMSFVLNSGDIISMYVTTDTQYPNTVSYGSTNVGKPVKILAGSTFNAYYVNTALAQGEAYTLSDIYDTSLTLLDVINDLTRMFNLHFETNNDSRTIKIEPRDDFYLPITDAVDWTNKIDVSKPYVIDYVNQYAKELDFNYKNDSADGYVEGWQKEKNITLAEYKHTLPDRFEKGVSKYDLDLFSPTMHIIDSEARYKISGVGKPITARLWKHYNQDDTYPDFSNEFNFRILNYVYGTQTDSNGLTAQINFNGATSNIPAALFQSFEWVNAPINLNWAGSDGLFATYYSKTLKNIEITPRASAYFDLSNSDIRNFSFRRPIYLDYPSELKGYYIVESIENYDFKDNTVKVNLLRYVNVSPVSINSTITINTNTQTNQKNDISQSNKGQIIKTKKQFGASVNAAVSTSVLGGNNPTTVLENNTGNQAVAGSGAVVWGVGLTSNAYYQTVYGTNNIPDEDAQVIIGAGTPSQPANAITIKNGNIQFYGGQVYIKKTLADSSQIWLPVVIVGDDDKLQNVYLSE